MDEKFLTYKGRPFVRCGNTIYYGSMADPFVVKMEIKTTKTVSGKDTHTEVADKIRIQLLTTDPNVSPKRQILKVGDREGIFMALDTACFWLDRATEEASKAAEL